MQKNKYIGIAIITFVFILFVCIQIHKPNYSNVLKVNSPFEIVVDFNKNGIPDDKETITLNYDYEYISKDNIDFGLKLGLDNNKSYIFAYLTEKYINDVLIDKKVAIKTRKGKTKLYIGKEKYSNILKKSGLFFHNGTPLSQRSYNNRLKQIQKSDFRLYNVKSNKYHKPECIYGHLAHNYLLLASYQLPKGAKPCKYCYKEKYIHKHKKSITVKNYSITSGAIKLILNDFTTHLIPNRTCNTEMCNELVKQINNAKYTIDIAIYGYDRVPKIERAIKQAINRGVKVRLVHDITSTNSNIYTNTFYFANIIKNSNSDKLMNGVKNSVYTNSIMHDKFYIFDNSIVVTGSANLSHTDMSDYNSNALLIINSKQIAQIFTDEFNQMYEGKFHNLKNKIENKTNIKLLLSTISIYFSPTDNITNTVLIPYINNAQKYIYIPIFAITDSNLANALISAKRRGVDVKIILDATNARNSYSKHKLLRTNGIPVKVENYAGKLHSKSIIIDDKISIIGSMNYSKSGNTKNDENVVLIKDSIISKDYKQFFIYLWNKIPNYCLTHDVAPEGIYSIGSCSDGIDNDYDGKTDMEDEGCKFTPKKLIN